MASIRARADSGKLFFDFRFQGVRCREQTLLDDTPANRRRLEKVLQRIELEIHQGVFDYSAFFPGSKLAAGEQVVVVTINYRLGFFGSMGHPALRGKGRGSRESCSFAWSKWFL